METIPKKNFVWSNEDEVRLIKMRMELNPQFTGRRGSAAIGWETVSRRLCNGSTPHVCKSKWDNLVLKYKQLKNADEDSPGNDSRKTRWHHFDVLDKFFEENHDFQILIDTSHTTPIQVDTEIIRVDVPELPDSDTDFPQDHTYNQFEDDPIDDGQLATTSFANNPQAESDDKPNTLKKRKSRYQEPQSHISEMIAYLKEVTEREERDRQRIMRMIETILHGGQH